MRTHRVRRKCREMNHGMRCGYVSDICYVKKYEDESLDR